MGFGKKRFNQIKAANQAAQPDGATNQPGPPIKIAPGGSISVPAGTTLTMSADGTLCAQSVAPVTIVPISIAEAYPKHINAQSPPWAQTTRTDSIRLYKRLIEHCANPVDVAAKKRNPATAADWKIEPQLRPITNVCDLLPDHFRQFTKARILEPVSKRSYGLRFITLLNWSIQQCYILRATGEACVLAAWIKREDAEARRVVPLTADQFGQMMDHMVRRMRKGKKDAFRDLMIIRLAHNMCLRTAEICRLKIKDVSLEHMKANVLRKGGKYQLMKIDIPDLQTDMREYVEHRCTEMPNAPTDPDSPLFLFRGHAPTHWNVYSLVSKTLRRCGIYRSLKKGAHLLRATGAVFRLRTGLMDITQVQKMLGHKSVATTEIYLGMTEEELDMILETRYTQQRLMRQRDFGRGYAIQR